MKKLYMASLGAGEFELITLKALNALKNSDIICVPTKTEDSFKKSLTYPIVKEALKYLNIEKKIIPVYSPMKFEPQDWQNQVDIIIDSFKDVDTISFVTLGDAGVYSTVYYLIDILKKDYKDIYENLEVIAGVTSFSNASAKIKKPLCLGDSKLEIIPLIDKELKSTKVYMRPKRGSDLSEINEVGEIYTFENLNFKEEQIIKGKVKQVQKYMTLIIDFLVK